MKYVPKSKIAAPAVAAPAVEKITPVIPVEDDEPLQVAEEEDDQSAPMEVESAPAEVSYYNPSGSMPPRAAATLRRHALPKGDIGDWPLDDAHVATFDQAMKFRRRIDNAASLYRILFLLIAICDAIGVVAGIGLLVSSPRSAGPAELGVVAGMAAVYIGITVLYFFAWKGTSRSQVWAPLTMGILFILGGLIYFAMIFLMPQNSRSDAIPMYVGFGFIILMAGLFAYVSFRAYAAIPKYLRQPAWCQELLSKTGK